MASITAFFKKIKNWLIVALSATTAVLAGLFIYEKKEAEVQNALADNAQTQTQVNSINTQITNVENTEKEEENAPVTNQDLLDFLNSDNKPK